MKMFGCPPYIFIIITMNPSSANSLLFSSGGGYNATDNQQVNSSQYVTDGGRSSSQSSAQSLPASSQTTSAVKNASQSNYAMNSQPQIFQMYYPQQAYPPAHQSMPPTQHYTSYNPQQSYYPPPFTPAQNNTIPMASNSSNLSGQKRHHPQQTAPIAYGPPSSMVSANNQMNSSQVSSKPVPPGPPGQGTNQPSTTGSSGLTAELLESHNRNLTGKWDTNDIQKKLDENSGILVEWEKLLDKSERLNPADVSADDVARHIALVCISISNYQLTT